MKEILDHLLRIRFFLQVIQAEVRHFDYEDKDAALDWLNTNKSK